jgi:hypothetical protein
MKRIIYPVAIAIVFSIMYCQPAEVAQDEDMIEMSKAKLKDKIKGAWAAQTIGVTFGLPIEFEYNSTMVQDNQKIPWHDSSMYLMYRDIPGTYDDIYMDLSFMQVIEDKGVDAPAQDFANSFANADYKLWFANQTARYNIQHGLTPPESGHWLNNPCADDIDFQIEADFAGLMAPGMINSAVEICDKVGHIMNYGDGYYGGVFVAAMYAQALVSNEVSEVKDIAKKALQTIPAESKFAQCISDVIRWYEEDPDDWKATWFKTSRKWGVDIGSPLGVFRPFNIDAKINAAWVTIGLLYGNGDFTRTFEIATRCGDDADCNPATAGGILAAIVGYENIPEFWTKGIEKVENLPFMGTNISLIDAYDMSYRHAEDMIQSNGGTVGNDQLQIKVQEPREVPLEIAFEGHHPVASITPQKQDNEITFEFEGIGFAVAGPPNLRDLGEENHVFETQMYIDDQLVETIMLPTATNKRRFTPFFKYQLSKGKHQVRIKIMNPVDHADVQVRHVIIYDNEPYNVNL